MKSPNKMAMIDSDLQAYLPLVVKGKVRDLYAIDDKTLFFVATDRISAYDVVLKNVRTPISAVAEEWFR